MKEKIKKILMSLRNVNNSSAINYLLGELDMMSEEELNERLNKIPPDDNSIISHLQGAIKQKLEEFINSGHYSYYPNAKENNRESRTFEEIKKAFEKIKPILDKENLTTYIAGGSVPYFLLNEDSHRLHDDIDTVCQFEDIDKIREALKRQGLYNQAWDSRTFAKDGKDYGFEIIVEGVPVSFSPFSYDGKILTQHTYDPYSHHCKIQEMELYEIEDYITSYESLSGSTYHTMSLEYIKKSKDNTIGRPKDKLDSEAISRIGKIRPDVLSRIKLPTLVQDFKAEDTEREK